MEMKMLLLLSAVALLSSPALMNPVPHHHKPNDNLNHIIDLVRGHNKTLNKVWGHTFVEDMHPLVDAGCESKIFCKVHQILHEQSSFTQSTEGEGIFRNLEIFTNSTLNCTELLKGDVKTDTTRPITDLLKCLTTCIRRRNVGKGSAPKPPKSA